MFSSYSNYYSLRARLGLHLAAVSAKRSLGVDAWRSVSPAITSSSCEARAARTSRRHPTSFTDAAAPHRATKASAAAYFSGERRAD